MKFLVVSPVPHSKRYKCTWDTPFGTRATGVIAMLSAIRYWIVTTSSRRRAGSDNVRVTRRVAAWNGELWSRVWVEGESAACCAEHAWSRSPLPRVPCQATRRPARRRIAVAGPALFSDESLTSRPRNKSHRRVYGRQIPGQQRNASVRPLLARYDVAVCPPPLRRPR